MILKADGVTADLFVEVLGMLANLCVPEFDFQALASRHDLLDFLAQFAAPGVVDDDILLEVIMFLGAAAALAALGAQVRFIIRKCTLSSMRWTGVCSC
jgi:Kinesin-associated protein (KAP)